MQGETHAPSVGEHVKNLLRAANISQDAVATQFGLSQQAVSRRITGDVQFSATELVGLAQLLGTSVDELLRPSPALADSRAS